MSQLSTRNLAKLVAEKYNVLSKLRDVGQQQMGLAGEGQVAQLLELLGTKQQLIVELQIVESELEPYRAEDPEVRQWDSLAARAACKKQAEECNQLLSEVVYLEKQSEDKMIARRNQVADQLQRAYSADQARGAYATHQAHKPTAQPHAAQAQIEPLTVLPGGLDLVSGA